MKVCRHTQTITFIFILTLGQIFAFQYHKHVDYVMTPRICNSQLRMAAKKGKAKEMQYVKLGKSDLEVSEVCLGTMTFGQQNTIQEAHEQLDIAFNEYGINFLDTAEMYPVPAQRHTQGDTDRYIGKWLKDQKREDIILATKVSGYSEYLKYIRPKEKAVRPSEKQILQSVDQSLMRLQTDYIDLLQIHWPDRYVPLWGNEPYIYDEDDKRERIPFEEQLRALEKVVKAGKVRYIGLSNESPYGLYNFIRLSEELGLPRVHSIQNCYNLLHRNEFDSGLLEVCRPQNTDVSLLAYSPLGGGSLAGKYAIEMSAPQDCRLNLFPGYMSRYKSEPAKDAVLAYMKVAEKYNISANQMALSWCYSRPYITSTIIGATSVAQLRENIEAYQIEMTEEMEEDIYETYCQFREPARGLISV